MGFAATLGFSAVVVAVAAVAADLATGASFRSSTKLTRASWALSPRRVTSRVNAQVTAVATFELWCDFVDQLVGACNGLQAAQMTWRRLCRSPFLALVISFST